jgi:hypothetical protein
MCFDRGEKLITNLLKIKENFRPQPTAAHLAARWPNWNLDNMPSMMYSWMYTYGGAL